MKPQEMKRQFVEMRAEGKSFSTIAEELHISKTTCSKWEQEMESQISDLQKEQLRELYDSYHMGKEARIRRLGDTLARIDDALASVDLSETDPAKLLDFKLKYTEALKGEYVGTKPALQIESIDAKQIVAALGDLLNRVRAGEVTTEQAQKESGILAQLLKAYDTVEVKAKLDELEAIIGGRQ